MTEREFNEENMKGGITSTETEWQKTIEISGKYWKPRKKKKDEQKKCNIETNSLNNFVAVPAWNVGERGVLVGVSSTYKRSMCLGVFPSRKKRSSSLPFWHL